MCVYVFVCLKSITLLFNFHFNQVNLQKCDIFELKTLKEPIDYLTLANNPETLEKVEGCMKVWIKQTEQVISRNQTSIPDATILN